MTAHEANFYGPTENGTVTTQTLFRGCAPKRQRRAVHLAVPAPRHSVRFADHQSEAAHGRREQRPRILMPSDAVLSTPLRQGLGIVLANLYFQGICRAGGTSVALRGTREGQHTLRCTIVSSPSCAQHGF
jgi:hypothetical protein